jgi:3-hydroxymyristoyl/3-hydroxydecanoyl-(acyl carrier protein) dehydratase
VQPNSPALQPVQRGAFTFVDRVLDLEPGTRARGIFMIPPGAPALCSRPSVIAEAVGQLAAWVAMDQLQFAKRPVAGIAGHVIFHGDARPADSVALEVELASCDDTAVVYDGRARAGDGVILELKDCMGPMLPLEEFDDPDAVRQRFAALCGEGLPPYSAAELDELYIAPEPDGDYAVTAILHVPESSHFFPDHFPRRPVLPGSLLLDAQIRLAMALLRQAASSGRDLAVASADAMKLREFILPGQDVDLRAEFKPADADATKIRLTARIDDRSVSTCSVSLVPGRVN